MNALNPNDAVVSLNNITKMYGDFCALKSLKLNIKEGELYGFLGPNGAGKTTLIRILTGIIRPTAGSVVINGFDMSIQPELSKAQIGFVPDRPYLYEKLTPMEYYEFMAGLYGLDIGTAVDKGCEVLKLFGMWNWKNELIESFSHGMKQKVAISAAILHDPGIFVIDEPTVGLDPKSVKILKVFFTELTKKGKTVFLATHTLSVAEDICDRIGIIHKGNIVAEGTMSDLRNLASAPGSDLENIFLKLTEEEETIAVDAA